MAVETILGLKQSVDPPVFCVRLTRSSNADVLWMTRDQVASHPGGQSHLNEFDSLAEKHGLKPNPSVPALQVPNIETSEEPRVLDHIVGFDVPSGLYLVKWQNMPYQDATWEHEVRDPHAVEVFRRRETWVARPARPPAREFHDYGEAELPRYKNGNELRAYQIHALNWLRFHYHARINSILADEMGLGKTVMCIALLQDIVTNCGVTGPFLIVAPLGTLPNWKREFENWTDINTVVLHGARPGREVIKRYEIFYSRPHETIPKVQVLLTNVETVTKEIELIRSIRWHFVIIDEAHRLKNLRAKIYSTMY
jgi:hypothetical protein